MRLRRILALLSREAFQGPRNFIFVFAVVIPVAVSLAISLLFGDLFASSPTLGVVDLGDSALLPLAEINPAISLEVYADSELLREAVSSGAVDFGVVLPAGFDQAIRQNTPQRLEAFVWGESLSSDRIIIATAIAGLVREIAAQEAPIDIVVNTLGDGQALSLDERLLPTVVLMAIIIGGSLVPASSLVLEKEQGTLRAVTVTPATLNDVFIAKGTLGTLVSVIMGVIILLINQAFGQQPLLLLLFLTLGAVMAALFGLLLGALTKDITSLFATVKTVGIFLYAPAIVFLFPSLPQWIGRLFPTYYVVAPVMAITQQSVTFADVATDLAILVGLLLLTAIGLLAVMPRSRLQTA
ncbi:MAG: ABC transporter permease [Candidatus Promineifilaceae bacterium]|nr:ABC transporter permease [Candidatus Promineifilaceae bacterium]